MEEEEGEEEGEKEGSIADSFLSALQQIPVSDTSFIEKAYFSAVQIVVTVHLGSPEGMCVCEGERERERGGKLMME